MIEKESFVIGRLFIYTIVGVVLVGTSVFLWNSFRPTFLDQEREAQIHSPQYVEARRTEILNNVEECRRLNARIAMLPETGAEGSAQAMMEQRFALASRIRRALAQLPEDERTIDYSACE